MMGDRNKTSHIYDEAEAKAIFEKIKNYHIKVFETFLERMDREILRIDGEE